MIGARCSLASPDFFENASAAQCVAGLRRLILHAPIDFLRFEDLPAVGKSNMHTFADRTYAFAFKGENVGQESFNTRIGHGRHRSPLSRIEYMLALPP